MIFHHKIAFESMPLSSNYMFKLFKKTHEAEKAKLLFEKLKKLDNFVHNTYSYNCLIKALGSRRDYAAEAIQLY